MHAEIVTFLQSFQMYLNGDSGVESMMQLNSVLFCVLINIRCPIVVGFFYVNGVLR